MVGRLPAEEVILYLKSGDQISGLIVLESTNQVVISNAWVKALAVPLAEVSKRETVAGMKPVSLPEVSKVVAPEASSAPAGQLATNPPSTAKPSAPTGVWHGQVNVGLNALFSTKTQQNYFGKLKLTYEQAYASSPKKFFRNTSQLSGEYQKTDDRISANRGRGSNKSDFDIGEASYGYSSVGGGFDEVRKIDTQYQIGSGMGRHLIRRNTFVQNIEAGLDYEAEYRSDAANLESVYLRLAEDFSWKFRKNLTLTEKIQFYSNLEESSQYRVDFTANLSYGFWGNLSLNLTAEDAYTTEVAPGVERNEFEIRLTLGLVF